MRKRSTDLGVKETRRNRPAFLLTLAIFAAVVAVGVNQIPAVGPLVSPIPDSDIRALEGRLLAVSVPCVTSGDDPVPCIATDVTIEYDANAPAGFEGFVQSEAPCVAGRTVDLYHSSSTLPVAVTPVGTTTSGANGSWHIDVPSPQVGTYTVVVAGTPAGPYPGPVHCDEGENSKEYSAVGSNVIAFITNSEPFHVNIGGPDDECRQGRTVKIYEGGTSAPGDGVLVGSATFNYSTTIPVMTLTPNATYWADMDAKGGGTVFCNPASRSINVGDALVTNITSFTYDSSTFSGNVGPGDCRISTRRVRLQKNSGGGWVDTGDSSGINFQNGNFSITHSATPGAQYRVYIRPYVRNDPGGFRHCAHAASDPVTA